MKLRATAILVAAVMVVGAAACGSRGATDNEPGGTTTTTPGSSSINGVDLKDGKFGTIQSPCGTGDAKGATDVGITDTEIHVVTVADPAAPAQPGLNQGVFDSAKAFEQWCNDQGGINGRKLRMEQKDAKLFEYAAVVAYACENGFSLMGGIAALDGTGAQAQVNCKLPNVPAAAVSPEQTGADYTFQPLPNPSNKYLVGPAIWVRDTFPGVAQNAAMLNTDLAVTNIQAARQIEAYEQVGFNFVIKEKVGLGETNFGPLVQAMESAGAQFMSFSTTWEKVIPLQKEMELQGWKPQVAEMETNFYNAKYPVQGSTAVDGTYVRLTAWPVEEADQNPAMAEYLAALKQAVPNSQPELLGIQGWSASLMAAQALKNLGSNITRQGFVDELKKVTSWNGGGLHGTSDPGQNQPAPCFIMMQIKGDKFERAYPLKDKDAAAYESGDGFACNPSYTATLTGNYGTGVKATS